MLKYAKVINEDTKQCEVGLGDSTAIFNEVEKIRTWQETEQQEQVVPAEYDEWGNLVKEETTEIVDVSVEKSENYIEITTVGEWYESIGMTEQDVEQAYDGNWYLVGYSPEKPAPTYEEVQKARANAYAREVDPLMAEYNRKKTFNLFEEGEEEALLAKIEEKVEEIKARYPYPVVEGSSEAEVAVSEMEIVDIVD